MAWKDPKDYNWDKLEFEQQLLTKHFNPRTSRKIEFGVVHHMMIPRRATPRATLQQCYDTWQTRQASAHYGVEGPYVRQFVWDKDYAWATGNTYGNEHGISVEHANSALAPRYPVDEETWKNGAKLMAYLHKNFGWGTPVFNKTIRYHGQFNGTECPGPFLKGMIASDYTQEVQHVYKQIMGGKAPTTSHSRPSTGQSYIVQKGDTLSKIGLKFGKTAKALQNLNGIKDPNLIFVGQRLNVGGSPSKKSNAEIAKEVIAGKWGNGQDRTNRLRIAGYDPSAVQRMVNAQLR